MLHISNSSLTRFPTVARLGRVAVGVAILVVLNFAGAWLAHVAHASVPGSVAGMLLLTALVQTGILPETTVRAASGFLIRHLALLLVPTGAAILLYTGALQHSMLAIVVAALSSLVAVLLVVGLLAERLVRQP